MLYSVRHSSRHDSRIPILLVYLGYRHSLELSSHPRGAGFCLWYYCVEGKGDFTLDGKRIIVQPGQCVVAFPDTPFSCREMPGGCVIHLLGVTGPCCIDILRVCGIAEPGVYQIADGEIFPGYMERFLQIHQNRPSQEAYSALCYELFVTLAPRIRRLTDAQPPVPESEAVQTVIEYLETHYQEPVSLETLAREVNLTREYLCVLFKKETRHTILRHLTLIRIGWARLYLEQYPEKSVKEIGTMCGFDNPSYFGKIFKRTVGMTPESYRRVNSIVL